MNVFKCKFMGTPAEILVSVLLACSKRSDSGAVLLLPRFIFSRSFLLRTAPHYLNAWNRLLCCLLWFDSSVLSVEVTVQCVVYKYLWDVPSKNINRTSISKQNLMQYTYECLQLSFNGRKCFSLRCTCNGISCKSTDQLDYDLECLQGISDNIPTLHVTEWNLLKA